jgi:uncharacterized protein (DUF849 family)
MQADLPTLMVAPNGARLGRGDHSALPVTVEQIVDCAARCHRAGADGAHVHVRDADGAHVLDAGLYRELIAELILKAPDMTVQITTEAVGRYSPLEQRRLVSEVKPRAVSVALREITADGDEANARRFWHETAEAGTDVQHILYSPAEVLTLATYARSGALPSGRPQVLYVLGRYAEDQLAKPADLDPFLAAASAFPTHPDWAVCAFGRDETACLVHANRRGGKLRVGFENNLYMADGTIAPDNAARVGEVAAARM